MNIEFKYDKGSKRLVVSNEFGQLTEREYFDNIGELLIQENIIEETQKALEENSKERTALLKEIKSIKSQIKSHEQKINLQKEEETKKKMQKRNNKKEH